MDTGVLVAATDRSDPHHTSCARLLEAETEQLVTTAMVIAESAYLIDRELGPQAEATLYQSITDGQLRIDALTTQDWQRVHDLVIDYANLRLGGTDASLIALAERHRTQRIATLNLRHFAVVRPSHIDAFTLLPSAHS
ncbi:type II toxin-antitoxin system VapC family toxin [Tsukamurella soli]|uniref:type II toxin-antitoxin system VapC family toxin n=1 Tax=Tsukamurella soli TaxID=644556 RepID=UPI0036157471